MVTPSPEHPDPRQRWERRSELETERVEQRRREAREHEWNRRRYYARKQEKGERSERHE